MPTDLALHIQETPLCDTHEHLNPEDNWLHDGPDILTDLFGNYVEHDLRTAGATDDAVKRLFDREDPDIPGRFEGVRKAWEATRFTGYGEAVRILARDVYGMDDLTGEGLLAAQETLKNDLRKPGEHYRLLKDRANLDHVQIDNFCWACLPDEHQPEFYLYDLNWAFFCTGGYHGNELPPEVGVQPDTLEAMREGQQKVFQKYGRNAIAVKSQHAYNRTLDWTERSDEEAARAFQSVRYEKGADDYDTMNCLGDWSWARGVELAADHNLPFKIHTGYYAGNGYMSMDRIKSGNLHRMLKRYPDTRFVLMHIAYPYSEELTALAKHFPNVWVDLCWAWSINPRASVEFVRRFLHAVPINKLFVFGGDTFWPTSTVAYAHQARQGLTRALEAEVEDGYLTEREAIEVATRLMCGNAYDCFDIEGTRTALREGN